MHTFQRLTAKPLFHPQSRTPKQSIPKTPHPPQNSTMSSPALKDLPKVAVDLKSQLEGFSTEKLKNIDTQEKIVLPTAEGKCFDDTHTHTHGSVCQVGRACESIARPN